MEKQTCIDLTQAGIEALRSGNRGAARGLFRQVVKSGRADAAIWLAYARRCDDAAERLRAFDAALALKPRNLHALIMKGDHMAGAGDLRGATAYYAAVDKAAAAGVAPQLVREVEQVREAHEAWNDSDRPRVILLFDVWRPELSEVERGSIADDLVKVRNELLRVAAGS